MIDSSRRGCATGWWFSLSLSLSLCATELRAQIVDPPSTVGQWLAPFDHAAGPQDHPTKPPSQTFVPDVNPADMFEMWGNPTYVGRFNAIHMSLIPRGLDQGKVLIWGHQNPWRQNAQNGIYFVPAANQARVIFWSILDQVPTPKSFLNFMSVLPLHKGDLFCAGHAWSDDGNLIVMGGSGAHGGSGIGNGWEGSKLAYLYDPTIRFQPGNPTVTPWVPLPDLEEERWYPTVLDLGLFPQSIFQDENVYLVLGGTHNGTSINSYQAWWDGTPPVSPRAWQIAVQNPLSFTFSGPGGGASYALGDYPRAHLTSAGRGVTAGMRIGSAYNEHHNALLPWNQKWLSAQWQQSSERIYGSSVLFPISIVSGVQDNVLSLGGIVWASGTILGSAQTCVVSNIINPSWSSIASLAQPRWLLNTVLLPDGSVLAIGGERTSTTIGCAEVPANTPELYAGGTWTQMATTDIHRNYHSTALLLPSGDVLVAGGEWRKYLATGANGCNPPPQNPPGMAHAVDYQIFQPPYLFRGPRPVINPTSPPGSAWDWFYGGNYIVSFDPLPLGVEVTRAVLARPGSVTHHSDGNQRIVELTVNNPGDGTLMIDVPTNNYVLPRGYYMLFLLTDQGVPSVAAWVRIV